MGARTEQGTRNPKWDKNRGTKREQEPQSGTRMGKQSGNKNPKVGQEQNKAGILRGDMN